MLTKYIVYWILLKVVPSACTCEPEVDDFGRQSSFACGVYHTKTILEAHSKEFSDQGQALKQYNEATQALDIRGAQIDSISIDTSRFTYRLLPNK